MKIPFTYLYMYPRADDDDLKRFLKTPEHAESTNLCARIGVPSHTTVASNRSLSSLNSANDEVNDVWKSFHFKQNASSVTAPMVFEKFPSCTLILLQSLPVSLLANTSNWNIILPL